MVTRTIGWVSLVMCLGLAACGGDDGGGSCEFSSCGVGGTGSGFPLSGSASARVELDCGSNSIDCTATEQDEFGRVNAFSCSYDNGSSFSCSDIMFDGIGQVIGGHCEGEGASCDL